VKRITAHATAAAVIDIRPCPAWRTGDLSKPFCVECGKSNGVTWSLFARYSTFDEASKIRNRLLEVGCPARVVKYE
jgi:hypothetical protein